VVSAVIATGEANCRVCHPEAVSLVKTPLAKGCPDVVHSVPVCEPVLAVAL